MFVFFCFLSSVLSQLRKRIIWLGLRCQNWHATLYFHSWRMATSLLTEHFVIIRLRPLTSKKQCPRLQQINRTMTMIMKKEEGWYRGIESDISQVQSVYDRCPTWVYARAIYIALVVCFLRRLISHFQLPIWGRQSISINTNLTCLFFQREMTVVHIPNGYIIYLNAIAMTHDLLTQWSVSVLEHLPCSCFTPNPIAMSYYRVVLLDKLTCRHTGIIVAPKETLWLNW